MAYDFPASPTTGQVYQSWSYDGEKWVSTAVAPIGAVRYDLAQGLNANQMAQARSNIALTKKNYIVNGGMQVSQENGVTVGNASVGFYPVDAFVVFAVGTSGTAFTQQTVGGPTPGGSPNTLYVSVGTADTSVDPGDFLYIEQRLEGIRTADLKFGSAAAKTIIIQFGVWAPAGTYSLTIINGANNRSYLSEYTISAGEANSYTTVKTVIIPGDVTGTWAKDNTRSMVVRWGLMAGTTYQQAAGSWGTSANAVGSPNQFNLLASTSNVFQLFDVSLTEGSVAPPFQLPDYASELALCQRYYQYLSGLATSMAANNVNGVTFSPMRAAPALTPTIGSGTGATFSTTLSTFFQTTNHSASAGLSVKLNARL